MRYEIEIEIKEVSLGDGRDGVVFRFTNWQIDRVGMKRKLLSGLPESAIPAQREQLRDLVSELSCSLREDPTVVIQDGRGEDFYVLGVSGEDSDVVKFIDAVNRTFKNVTARFAR